MALPDTLRSTSARAAQRAPHADLPSRAAESAGPPTALVEQWMTAARPRLLRFACAHGLSIDAAHEVVQETMLEAWRHLDALSAPAGFQTWLNAICRNVCQRYRRAHHLMAQRELPLVNPTEIEDGDGNDMSYLQEMPDPLALDPVDELERQDWMTLLDRALGFLSAPSREAVQLCYLNDLPQREAARQLGLTITALEARLHRARRQLRQVLNTELRAQAEDFGLPVAADHEDAGAGWRDTRLWCSKCGQRRLRGAFEPLAADRVNLRLRCPGCGHEINSWGHVPLQGIRSFRPAYKRVMRHASNYFQPGLGSGWLACTACGTPQPLRVVDADEAIRVLGGTEKQPGLLVISQCQACRRHHADIAVAALLWTHPSIQSFLGAHPRALTEPESYIEYLGQPAIRVRVAAVTSTQRLTLITHPKTLQVLATFEE